MLLNRLVPKLANFLVISLVGSLSFFANAAGETLELRNTSPLTQLYGIPAMRGARAENLMIRFSVDSANSFAGDVNASEFVFLDGETSTFSYTLAYGLGKRWEAGVELPWVVHSGGRFDGLIDEFHDLFGLPDGGRPLTERGALDYVVTADGRLEVDIRSKASSLGDIRGWAGYEILNTPGRTLVSRLNLKLPTGRAKKLSGSGGTDIALGLDYVDHSVLSVVGVQLSLGLGAAYLGEGDLLSERQKSFMPYGHFGLAKKLGRKKRWAFIGQLDAHGAIFDAELSHLGQAVLQGTLGLQFELTQKAKIEIALLEDLSGAAASDAIFKLSVVGRL